MVITTKQQRAKLKELYFRGMYPSKGVSYRQFRKTIQPEFAGCGAIMVPWCGMWIGIEKDGYAHS